MTLAIAHGTATVGPPPYAHVMSGPPPQPAMELSDGQKLIELILGSPDWIHRQVERVEIQPTGDAVHHVSLDLTVPPELALAGSRGAIVVPVTILQKGPLSGFDAIGPEDRPVPMLETPANSALSAAFLRALAAATYGYSPSDEPWAVPQLVADIVSADLRLAELAIDALQRLLSASPPGDGSPRDPVEEATFLSMADVFSRYFLMAVELDETLIGRRCIVKYSYLDSRDDPLDRPRYEMSWDLGHVGVAGSYHFELTSPQLLELTSLTLIEITGSEIHRREADLPARGVSTGHLATRPRSRLSTAAVVAGLAPRRFGVVSQSLVGTWLVAGIFAVAVVGRHLLDLWNTGAAVAPTTAGILSAAGAIVLTWIARTPEDRVVAAVLRRPRRHLLGAGALLILAGLYMALPVPEPARTVGWYLMLAASVVVAVAATRHRWRSRPRPSGWTNSPFGRSGRIVGRDGRRAASDDADGR